MQARAPIAPYHDFSKEQPLCQAGERVCSDQGRKRGAGYNCRYDQYEEADLVQHETGRVELVFLLSPQHRSVAVDLELREPSHSHNRSQDRRFMIKRQKWNRAKHHRGAANSNNPGKRQGGTQKFPYTSLVDRHIADQDAADTHVGDLLDNECKGHHRGKASECRHRHVPRDYNERQQLKKAANRRRYSAGKKILEYELRLPHSIQSHTPPDASVSSAYLSAFLSAIDWSESRATSIADSAWR